MPGIPDLKNEIERILAFSRLASGSTWVCKSDAWNASPRVRISEIVSVAGSIVRFKHSDWSIRECEAVDFMEIHGQGYDNQAIQSR